MKKRILDTMTLIMVAGLTTLAQPKYDYSLLSTEKLDRGVVAVRQADGRAFISWRTLMTDPKGAAFDVYRNGQKLNQAPLTKGGTWFIDDNPTDEAVYEVRCEMEEGRGKKEDISHLTSSISHQPSSLFPLPSATSPYPCRSQTRCTPPTTPRWLTWMVTDNTRLF